MRAFRNQVHSQSKGYCGYLQMTAFTGDYGRYVLNNLVESLDKTYDDSQSETTGLLRLSTALAEQCRGTTGIPRERLGEGGLDQGEIDKLVVEMSDALILDERFSAIDVYLVQAMLYLQCNDPRIKARVLKYLRCEDLTERRPPVARRNRPVHLRQCADLDHPAPGPIDLGRRAHAAHSLR